MIYRVNEIFASIEGEGRRAGLPCVFVRLVGCNLRCSFCDTAYAFEPSDTDELLDEAQIAARVREYGLRAVTITGGEPLTWDLAPLLDALADFEVDIETNGSIELPAVADNVFFTMDWKAPSSDMSDAMCEANLARLTSRDVLKFVVGSTEDMRACAQVLASHDIAAQVFFSPVFGAIEPREIAEFLVENALDARLQIQLHKVVWSPDARGV